MLASGAMARPATSSALHRRRPVLLLGFLLALVALAAGLRMHLREPLLPEATRLAEIDWTQYPEILAFQEFLRIDSSYPDGNEIPAAEFLARHLSEAGVSDITIERLGERNANLWATLPGENPEALVLHQHVDVVPPQPHEVWLYPPFSGRIAPPFIYGRGAFDMKSVGIAQLFAMAELARSGTPLERSVTMLATGDEERDSWMGTRRLLDLHPEWADQMWVVLTEGGAIEANSLEDVRYWGTEFQQKRYVDVWVCDASAARLEALRSDLLPRRTELQMTDEIARFLRAYAPSRDRSQMRDLFARPEVMLERLRTWPDDVGPTVIPPHVDRLMRDWLAISPVHEAPGGGFRIRVIVHLLPHKVLDDVWESLFGDGILNNFTTIIEAVHDPVAASPIDHPVFQTIDQVVEGRFPEIDHGPTFIPFAATDARYFREVGIDSFGFSPFRLLATDANNMKGANERMPLDIFVEGVELYTDLVRALVVAPAGGDTAGDSPAE
ncbi:MAG: M20/M25/M40 family metallo-hydrolase [Acidobacteriota bacterium]